MNQADAAAEEASNPRIHPTEAAGVALIVKEARRLAAGCKLETPEPRLAPAVVFTVAEADAVEYAIWQLGRVEWRDKGRVAALATAHQKLRVALGRGRV